MRNLVIDIGNSAVKYAVFDKGECLWHCSANKNSQIELEKALSFGIDYVAISSVSTIGDELHQAIEDIQLPTIRISTKTKLPFKIADYIPNTLGADRISAVAGAFQMFPHQNVLVIDLGTCITYEFLTEEGIYTCGNIAPGLQMRLKAMHEHTTLLPEYTYNGEWPDILGTNTRDAMIGGVVWGIKGEMECYIRTFLTTKSNIKVILTGGDSKSFVGRLETPVCHDSMLVEKGLNYILEYNFSE